MSLDSAIDLRRRVIFLNYGTFDNNSGMHIGNFANELARLGLAVGVCAEGDPSSAPGWLDPDVAVFSHLSVDLAPAKVVGFGDAALGPADTIVHAWTPRERVCRLTRRLAACGVLAVFVHLEDNEEVLTAANLGVSVEHLRTLPAHLLPDPFPHTLSHPQRYRAFLAEASGVTVIAPPLARFAPAGKPVHVLEPGVDLALYAGGLEEARRDALRAELGVAPDEAVCVYAGNMHAANAREVFSLYAAMLILRRRGRRVRLVRTGRDSGDGIDQSYADLRDDDGVTTLGFLPRERLIEVLKLADFFVQPGRSDPFNDYRFPSKLPEFFACGKPVVLPLANVGLRLRDGEQALLLRRGDGWEIADQVEKLLDDPGLAARIGAGGQAFARMELDWRRNARALIGFYSDCARGVDLMDREGDMRC